ncbi:MAG: hypothetical protein WAL46_04980, partial [Nitrososphaeraceae archaeon]
IIGCIDKCMVVLDGYIYWNLGHCFTLGRKDSSLSEMKGQRDMYFITDICKELIEGQKLDRIH